MNTKNNYYILDVKNETLTLLKSAGNARNAYRALVKRPIDKHIIICDNLESALEWVKAFKINFEIGNKQGETYTDLLIKLIKYVKEDVESMYTLSQGNINVEILK